MMGDSEVLFASFANHCVEQQHQPTEAATDSHTKAPEIALWGSHLLFVSLEWGKRQQREHKVRQ